MRTRQPTVQQADADQARPAGPAATAVPPTVTGRDALTPPTSDSSVDSTTSGRRERHRRETFERLVRAAREVMFKRGFNDITVQDITDAADVGKGTFFNYFRSKEHIVSRVQEYNRRGVQRAAERVRAGQPPAEAVAELLNALLCPTGGDWLTYQSNTMRALALHADERQLFALELDAAQLSHRELMAAGQQQGSIRNDVPSADLSMVTQTFLAGLTVVFWIQGISPTPAIMNDVTKRYFALLSPAPTPPPPARPKHTAKPARRRRAGTTRRPAARMPARTTGRRAPAKRR